MTNGILGSIAQASTGALKTYSQLQEIETDRARRELLLERAAREKITADREDEKYQLKTDMANSFKDMSSLFENMDSPMDDPNVRSYMIDQFKVDPEKPLSPDLKARAQDYASGEIKKRKAEIYGNLVQLGSPEKAQQFIDYYKNKQDDEEERMKHDSVMVISADHGALLQLRADLAIAKQAKNGLGRGRTVQEIKEDINKISQSMANTTNIGLKKGMFSKSFLESLGNPTSIQWDAQQERYFYLDANGERMRKAGISSSQLGETVIRAYAPNATDLQNYLNGFQKVTKDMEAKTDKNLERQVKRGRIKVLGLQAEKIAKELAGSGEDDKTIENFTNALNKYVGNLSIVGKEERKNIGLKSAEGEINLTSRDKNLNDSVSRFALLFADSAAGGLYDQGKKSKKDMREITSLFNQNLKDGSSARASALSEYSKFIIEPSASGRFAASIFTDGFQQALINSNKEQNTKAIVDYLQRTYKDNYLGEQIVDKKPRFFFSTGNSASDVRYSLDLIDLAERSGEGLVENIDGSSWKVSKDESGMFLLVK